MVTEDFMYPIHNQVSFSFEKNWFPCDTIQNGIILVDAHILLYNTRLYIKYYKHWIVANVNIPIFFNNRSQAGRYK